MTYCIDSILDENFWRQFQSLVRQEKLNMNSSEETLSLTKRIEKLIKLLSGFVAPFAESVSNAVCRNHSREYYDELGNGVSWASQMFDASAKIQTGVLTGNINSLGNFDECINVKNTTGEFVGQYCLTTLKIFENLSDISHKHGLKFMMERGMKWGYCIPSTCRPEDLTDSLTDYIKPKDDLIIRVFETDCHYGGDMPYSILDWFTVSLFIIILLLVFLSTLYDMSTEKLRGIREKKPLSPTTENITAKDETIEIPELSTLRSSGQNSSTSTALLPFDRKFPNQLSFNSKYSLTHLSNPALSDTNGSEKHLKQNISADDGASTSHNHGLRNNNGSSSHFNSGVPDINLSKQKYSSDSEISSKKTGLEFPGMHPVQIPTPNSEENSQSGLTYRGLSFWSVDLSPIDEDLKDAPRQRTPISTDDEFLDPPYKDPSWLSSFSLLSNWKHVFDLDNRKSTLHSLFAMKFLSALWLLIGHVALAMYFTPSLNHLNYQYNYRQWYYMLLQNSHLGIDTFFVITGMSISFTFLRDMRRLGISYKKDNPSGLTWKFFTSYLPLHYFQRFMRLTPVLALMILVQAGLYIHLGSGPLWYRDNIKISNSCKNYWWSILIYLNNYIDPDYTCLTHMYYLMVDMQLYLLSPIILLAFLVWPKRINFIITSSLFLAAMLISYSVNYILELPVGYWNTDYRKWSLKQQYDIIVTHARFGPWIVGIFVGYFLYHVKKSETRPEGDKIEGYARWLWLLSAMGIFYSVFGAITFYTNNSDNTPVNAAIYNCLSRNVWAMCIGWIVFACETNNGGFIQTFLTLKVFQPLSRVTYCFYLVHGPLTFARMHMTTTPIEQNEFLFISSICADVVLSTIIALVLVLCVELPFMRLFEALSSPWQYRVEILAPVGERTRPEIQVTRPPLQDNPKFVSETTPLSDRVETLAPVGERIPPEIEVTGPPLQDNPQLVSETTPLLAS